MGRLTNNIDYCDTNCDFGKRGECFFKEKSKCYEKSMHDKLKAYEDINDDPEKLKLVDALYLERCEEINRLSAELAEYKKLEEEGALLRLDAKPEEKIFWISDQDDEEFNYEPIEEVIVCNIDYNGYCIHLWFADKGEKEFPILPMSYIGKELFKTKEEAEQALERMKEVQEK